MTLPPPRTRTRTISFIAAGIAIVFLILFGIGVIPRIVQHRRLATAAKEASTDPQQVRVVHPILASEADLALAATTEGFEDAIIYARTSGYLRTRYVDLGDNVTKGQLLAEIESPEIDAQLRQSRADLQQSNKNLQVQQANLVFAKVTLDRYKAADKEGAVAKEDLDQRISAYQTAEASVAAAEANVESNAANVRHFEALTAFERVTAPFDGTVTQRNVDVGALITSGSPTNNTAAAPQAASAIPNGLFEISQLDTLRVFVNLPQVYAPNIKVGLPVDIVVRGQLTQPFKGSVTRRADALDPNTRTMLTEVDIPNRERRLLPGMFIYVQFKIGPTGTRWRIPGTAMIFNAQGTQVMLVGKDNKLELRKVVLGRDFGESIDVQSGIDKSDVVVKQPTVRIKAGQEVKPAEETDKNDEPKPSGGNQGASGGSENTSSTSKP